MYVAVKILKPKEKSKSNMMSFECHGGAFPHMLSSTVMFQTLSSVLYKHSLIHSV